MYSANFTFVQGCVCVCVEAKEAGLVCVVTHQQAVKEDVDKDPQAADNQVEQVVQELHVCDHGCVATCEGAAVPNKAHQEDDLVA